MFEKAQIGIKPIENRLTTLIANIEGIANDVIRNADRTERSCQILGRSKTANALAIQSSCPRANLSARRLVIDTAQI